MYIYYNDGRVQECEELRVSSPELLIAVCADGDHYVQTVEIYKIMAEMED